MVETINIPMAKSKYVFNKRDVEVSYMTVDTPRGSEPVRWGNFNGQHLFSGRMIGNEPAEVVEARQVTLLHIPTGIKVVENKFDIKRNISIGMSVLEALVNERIKEILQAEARLNNEA